MNLMELMSKDINAAFLDRNIGTELQIKSGVHLYSFPGIKPEQLQRLLDNLQKIIEASDVKKHEPYEVKIFPFNNKLPAKRRPVF